METTVQRGVSASVPKEGGGGERKKNGRREGSSDGFVHFYKKKTLSERLLQKGFLQQREGVAHERTSKTRSGEEKEEGRTIAR